MPLIKYIDKKLSKGRLATIAKANEIIAEYEAQGFQLTLRQLYYQFVARGLIENSQKSYDNLGATITDGRLCGLVDWESIIDRTRNLRSVPHWADPPEVIQAVAHQFRIDKWENQPIRPEVWIEKDAVAGVVEGVCRELDVPFFSCRGYTSASEMWAGAQRLITHVKNGQAPLILHFGDHDPSGMDMTRDIKERLQLFTGRALALKRLALNWEQIEEYQPPPNPAKTGDARAAGYIAEFGNESWELDALEPSVLVQLIRDTVLNFRDEDAWNESVSREDEHRSLLKQTSERWEEVEQLLAE